VTLRTDGRAHRQPGGAWSPSADGLDRGLGSLSRRQPRRTSRDAIAHRLGVGIEPASNGGQHGAAELAETTAPTPGGRAVAACQSWPDAVAKRSAERLLARGGLQSRRGGDRNETVIVEFESFEKASGIQSDTYKTQRTVLGRRPPCVIRECRGRRLNISRHGAIDHDAKEEPPISDGTRSGRGRRGDPALPFGFDAVDHGCCSSPVSGSVGARLIQRRSASAATVGGPKGQSARGSCTVLFLGPPCEHREGPSGCWGRRAGRKSAVAPSSTLRCRDGLRKARVGRSRGRMTLMPVPRC